ncbi:MaoC family dehydratase [Paraburkholderia sp. Tr-20389]|uniref:MaoC family dehydratase n=1 Tax=Paraburkholderia sp. Tr-20389 TaxID=2703903 RepID=UPI00197E1765|nr:MaoC family dehydratase [Paraburkholderia sp. Tr-20389]MBN3755609.1 MaoC family dehydratase [Paraburkholderia sp. Tr-20389]
MKTYETLSQMQSLVGEIVGTSNWVVIEQQRINTFADATGDHQWIHVDPERAAKGPFGAPIAHGFLTLSLLPVFLETAFAIRSVKMGVNYGLNRVRFLRPVPVNSRVRACFKLLSFEPIEPQGSQLTYEMTVETENGGKPVCVAESIVRLFD